MDLQWGFTVNLRDIMQYKSQSVSLEQKHPICDPIQRNETEVGKI